MFSLLFFFFNSVYTHLVNIFREGFLWGWLLFSHEEKCGGNVDIEIYTYILQCWQYYSSVWEINKLRYQCLLSIQCYSTPDCWAKAVPAGFETLSGGRVERFCFPCNPIFSISSFFLCVSSFFLCDAVLKLHIRAVIVKKGVVNSIYSK